MPPSPPPKANLLVLVRDDSSWLLRLRRYDEDQVRLLKTLPERRWDVEAKGWIVPSGPHPTKVLQRQFPGVRLPTPSKGAPLEHMRREMVVEGYSPKSRKVYLGHARRFLKSAPRLAGLPDPEESGPGSQDDDLAWIDADLVRRYLEKQNAVKQISRSSASQILSAIRLLVRCGAGARDRDP